MSVEVEWLERSLIVGPYLVLCLTPKQFVRAGKDLERRVSPKKWQKTDHAHATLHTWKGRNGLACVVCLRPPAKGISIEQIAGLLAHEATHVWQYYREWIGENEPSKEFEAYSVQAITQRLFESYRTQTKRARRRK